MRIQELMSKHVATIEHEASAADARALMQERGIRHLVVLRDGRIAGVVSERDVGGPRGAAPAGAVGAVMASHVVTVPSDATLRQAANLLRGYVIGCLPVVDDGRLVGIVTLSDILEVLGRGGDHLRSRARPYVARRQGPSGKPRGERLRRR